MPPLGQLTTLRPSGPAGRDIGIEPFPETEPIGDDFNLRSTAAPEAMDVACLTLVSRAFTAHTRASMRLGLGERPPRFLGTHVTCSRSNLEKSPNAVVEVTCVTRLCSYLPTTASARVSLPWTACTTLTMSAMLSPSSLRAFSGWMVA